MVEEKHSGGLAAQTCCVAPAPKSSLEPTHLVWSSYLHSAAVSYSQPTFTNYNWQTPSKMYDSSPALSDVTDTEYISSFVPINRDWRLSTRQASSPVSETPQKKMQVSTINSEIGNEPIVKKEEDDGFPDAVTVDFPIEESKPSVSPRKKGSASISPSKVRKASVSPSKAKRTIAASPAEASAEDKLMIYLKEEEHKSWSEIKLAIEKLTGSSASEKSLSKRYSRLKRNFGANEFDEEDIPYILKCKQEIEEKFQNELYTRISDALPSMGRPHYPAGVIKKKIHELMKGQVKISGF